MDKTMADNLIFIFNDNTQIYPFCRLKLAVETLYTQLNESTNQKSPKLLRKRIKKRYYKTLGTSVINNPLFPSSMVKSLDVVKGHT